jgi:hypothetical protein
MNIRYMLQNLLNSFAVPSLLPLPPRLKVRREIGVRFVMVDRYVVDRGELSQSACGARPDENFRIIAAMVAIQDQLAITILTCLVD